MIPKCDKNKEIAHMAQLSVSLMSSVICCTLGSVLNYIISSVMHTFWLVLTHDLLEDRHIDEVIIKTFFNSLLYKTNRFQVAVRLFSNRSQSTSKCGKNISDTLGCTLCATFFFLPHDGKRYINRVTFVRICSLVLK